MIDSNVIELGEHVGLSPANIVMADYRRPNVVAVTFIDPVDGLSTRELSDLEHIKFPPHFTSENPLGIDINYNLVGGCVADNLQSHYSQFHLRGARPGEIGKCMDVRDVSVAGIVEDAKKVRGLTGVVFQSREMNGATDLLVAFPTVVDVTAKADASAARERYWARIRGIKARAATSQPRGA